MDGPSCQICPHAMLCMSWYQTTSVMYIGHIRQLGEWFGWSNMRAAGCLEDTCLFDCPIFDEDMTPVPATGRAGG